VILIQPEKHVPQVLRRALYAFKRPNRDECCVLSRG